MEKSRQSSKKAANTKIKPYIIRDVVLKEFWSQNSHFADFFNGVLFKGKRVLIAEQLTDADTDVSGFVGKNRHGETLKQYRDVVKRGAADAHFFLFGLENQSHINLEMPLRLMIYDGLQYRKEVRLMKKRNREQKILAENDDFLSGLRRQDRLTPIISVVLYYGDVPWDGPTTLKEMMGDIPESLEAYISDYRIHVISLANTDRYMFQNEEVSRVFSDSRMILKEQYDILKEKSEKQPLTEELIRVVSAMTGRLAMIPAAQEGIGGEDMSGTTTAVKKTPWEKFEDYLKKEAEKKGLEEGREKGLAEGRDQVYRTLLQLGMLSAEEVERVSKIVKEGDVEKAMDKHPAPQNETRDR